ncbi:zinc metalloprotease [Chryseobacterium lactis]|uniref:hypothetical protein n=1 Tax=Chryseobacterium lactis TaxID=1241981 RepID=UPI001FE87A7C|nr:hypothetical protein [Chryseobacterium lactis]
MELYKKILFGSIISVALVACNTNDNVEEKAPEQGLTQLDAIPQSDIPAGFEKTEMCKDVYLPGEGYIPGMASKGAVITNKKWPNGSIITVGFYGGTTKVRNKVMQYAQEWSKYANITFKVITSGTPQIRVTFRSGAGSYSYLGTDALARPIDGETMKPWMV